MDVSFDNTNADEVYTASQMKNSNEGIQKKEEAQLRILAAQALNARNQFQDFLETAIDTIAGNHTTVDNTRNTTGTAASEGLDAMFDEASRTYNVDKQLLLAVARTESNFTPSATSSHGAMGVMQLMPETAKSLGVRDAYDAYENIMGGAKLLRMLLDKYSGDRARALAAYNAGSNAVDSYGGVPPKIQNYVNTVFSYYADGVQVPSSSHNTTYAYNRATAPVDNSAYNQTNASGVNANTANTANRNNILTQTLDAMSGLGGSSKKAVANDLKTAFAKFPEHQTYEQFLEELSEEMKNTVEPGDVTQAYRVLLGSAKTAIDRIRHELREEIAKEGQKEV